MTTMKTCLIPALLLLGVAASCTKVPEGPCDIYESYGYDCVAAHSTTRVLSSSYRGPLYQIRRESDGATLSIMPKNGYADASAHDAFSEGTMSYITVIYDQSGHGNHLYQAPPGTFKGPAKGQFNTLPIADMAPVTIDGRKAYGAYLMPGMGYRYNNASDLAINDEAEGMYYVIDGTHYDSGCCFDYGNASTNGKAVGTGTMETTYFGTSTAWGSGNGEGPWIMADMESGLFSGYGHKKNDVPSIDGWRFVSVYVNGGDGNRWDLNGGDATTPDLTTFYSGPRPHTPESDAYYPMSKKGAILLGNGGDNGNGSAGTFYEGVMVLGYPSQECIRAVQANIAAARYDVQPVKLSRLTTFMAGDVQTLRVDFRNTGFKTAEKVGISLELPQGWTCRALDQRRDLQPGEEMSSEFEITAPEGVSGGFVKAVVSWKGGREQAVQRVRCATAVKINELGLEDGGFVELHNPSVSPVDLSGYEVEITQSGWAPVRAAKLPEGTVLGAGEYLVLTPGEGALAMAAAARTTIFIPVSTGPWLRFPAGTDKLPVASVEGLRVGQSVAIGAGADYEETVLTSVGTAATQTQLAREARAGDTVLALGYTSELREGSVLTISTGQRIEKAVVKRVLSVQTPPPPHVVGIPDAPREPGEIELAEPLKNDHMNGVDVSCEGSGITFSPALRFAHESGDAIQADPSPALATDGRHLGYCLSPRAGAVALYCDGVLMDGVTYGSKQSNSSGNGTICRPDIATLEGDQDQGGCLAEVPASFFRSVPAIVRFPDGADRDMLCADFSPSECPTPGKANIKEDFQAEPRGNRRMTQGKAR